VPEIAEQIPPPLPFTGAGEEDFPDFDTVPQALRTALIADEDEGFRKLLALPLAAQGFRIFEAEDGTEGWRLATEHRPWLMLADIALAGIDGFEFCRRVRANSLLSHTPLVFISSSDKFKDRARAQQVGANDFLSKQTPIRELLIRIQVILMRYLDMGARGRSGPGMQGELNVMGAPGVLQVCHLTRLTGTLTVKDGARRMAVRFREGEIVGAEGEGKSGEAAIFALLAWEEGTFKFAPGDPGGAPQLETGFNQLLLEGCRLLDEERRADAG
jgi:DNA-binding response OmpR family regulator